MKPCYKGCVPMWKGTALTERDEWNGYKYVAVPCECTHFDEEVTE